MGLGAKWLLASSAVGNVDTCNAALLVMTVGLVVLPIKPIGWIVLSAMAADAEPESLLAKVNELGERPLLAYPGAIVLTVVAMLSVIVPVAKVAIKVGWFVAKLVAGFFAISMTIVLWLLSIFSRLY